MEGKALGLIYGTILERLRKLQNTLFRQSVSRFEPGIYRKQINSITTTAKSNIINIIIVVIVISQWRERYMDMELSNIPLTFLTGL